MDLHASPGALSEVETAAGAQLSGVGSLVLTRAAVRRYACEEVGIIALWRVHSRGDGPHAHQLGREQAQEVARVGLDPKPAVVILRAENDRHAVVDVGYKLVGHGRDDGEGPHPLARARVLPVLPDAREPKA